MRCFVAMDVSEEIKDALAVVLGQLKRDAETAGVRVSWTRPEGWHVTLKFLGDITAEQVNAVKAVVGEALYGVSSFRLSFARLVALPRAAAPRVLAVDVSDDGWLARSAESVDKALSALGFERERRRFTPHLTLGRIRSNNNNKGSRELARSAESYNQQMFGHTQVTEFGLYASELGRGGARYRVLERFALQAN